MVLLCCSDYRFLNFILFKPNNYTIKLYIRFLLIMSPLDSRTKIRFIRLYLKKQITYLSLTKPILMIFFQIGNMLDEVVFAERFGTQ